MVLPDPIPNSEVKHAWADDTLAYASRKVGSCPLIRDPSKSDGSFYLSPVKTFRTYFLPRLVRPLFLFEKDL